MIWRFYGIENFIKNILLQFTFIARKFFIIKYFFIFIHLFIFQILFFYFNCEIFRFWNVLIIDKFLIINIILIFSNCIFYNFSIDFVKSLEFSENFWLSLILLNVWIGRDRFRRNLKIFSVKRFLLIFINFFFVNSNSFSC